MTIEEAEEKKAYCGTCKHWRLLCPECSRRITKEGGEP